MSELNDIQKMMISKIGEEIDRLESKYLEASDEEKKTIEKRVLELKKQLENAKIPVHRTEDEVKIIDKMMDNVEKNIEIESGKHIENRGQELNSEQEFEYMVSRYVDAIKNQKTNLEKNLELINSVAKILEEALSNNSLTELQREAIIEDLKTKRQIRNQILMSIKTFDDRIDIVSSVSEWTVSNYSEVSKLNLFLGNPLKLKDYEDYIDNLKKVFEVE